MRILILTDRIDTSDALGRFLAEDGYDVTLVHDVSDAVVRLGGPVGIDAVLTDGCVAGMGGLEIMRALRGVSATVGVVIVSDRIEARERASFLDAGADDVLTKPHAYPELAARLRALSRRVGRGEEPAI